MAGKTFPGIGDLKGESPILDPADAADSADAHAYSGPTVVDDAKVEQGLKKLRSLDATPGPLTGIHRAVADVLADPSRATPSIPIEVQPSAPIAVEPSRGTAVGRSVSEPILSQQNTPAFDDRHLRGTMFGHSVHRPDLDLSDKNQEVETSKALAIVERGQPTSHEVAVFQPAPYPRYATPIGKTPYPPASRFRSTPYDLRTPTGRRRIFVRVGLAAVAIALVAGAALLWLHSNSDDGYTGPRPPATAAQPIEAAPPAAPTAPVQPAAAAAEAVGPPAPAAGTAPRIVPLPPPSRSADEEAGPIGPARPKPAPGVPTSPGRRSPPHPGPHAERRAAGAKTDEAQDNKPEPSDTPAKPSHGKRAVEEDPDGTMAPTIE